MNTGDKRDIKDMKEKKQVVSGVGAGSLQKEGMDGCMDGWMDERSMEGGMDGWMDERSMEGGMDGWTDVLFPPVSALLPNLLPTIVCPPGLVLV